MRKNIKGLQYERWNHSHGCRRWFNMSRDTSNDKIHSVYKMGEIHNHKTVWQLLSFWVGMIISTIFISLGAPFWFNRIKTLIQLKDKLSKVSVK